MQIKSIMNLEFVVPLMYQKPNPGSTPRHIRTSRRVRAMVPTTPEFQNPEGVCCAFPRRRLIFQPNGAASGERNMVLLRDPEGNKAVERSFRKKFDPPERNKSSRDPPERNLSLEVLSSSKTNLDPAKKEIILPAEDERNILHSGDERNTSCAAEDPPERNNPRDESSSGSTMSSAMSRISMSSPVPVLRCLPESWRPSTSWIPPECGDPTPWRECPRIPPRITCFVAFVRICRRELHNVLESLQLESRSRESVSSSKPPCYCTSGRRAPQ